MAQVERRYRIVFNYLQRSKMETQDMHENRGVEEERGKDNIDGDQVETNPTADNVESDDDQALVCYDFSNRIKDTPVLPLEELPVSIPEEEHNDSQDVEAEKQSASSDIPGIVLQQEQDDDLMEVSSRNRRESLEIIIAAFNERKDENVTNFNAYTSKREAYYSQFSKSLTKIEQGAQVRISETELFGKDLVRALKEIRGVYKTFSRDLAKINFNGGNTKDDSLWGRIFPQGLRFLSEYKNTCADSSRVFHEWIDSECLPKVEEAFRVAKEKTESELKEVKKQRQAFSGSSKSFSISKDSKFKDQLAEEFRISKLMDDERNKIQEWGAVTSRLLEAVSIKEGDVIRVLKFEMASIVGHLKLISRQSHHLFEAENYWISIPSDEDTIFNRILTDFGVSQTTKQVCKVESKLKMEDLHSYLILEREEEDLGNLKEILRQLHVSSYKVMADFDKNNKWRSGQAYFSVDNHLILLDECGSVRNCLSIVQMQHEVSEFDLKVRTRERAVFSSWNKERLRFSSSNQVEEFVMVIDSMRDLRLEQ